MIYLRKLALMFERISASALLADVNLIYFAEIRPAKWLHLDIHLCRYMH